MTNEDRDLAEAQGAGGVLMALLAAQLLQWLVKAWIILTFLAPLRDALAVWIRGL